MKTKRLLAVMLAAVMVLAWGLTSMAASTYKIDLGFYGKVETASSYVFAQTVNQDNPNGNAYVCVQAKYNTSSGTTQWSSMAEASSTSNATTTKSVNGTIVGAESGHGSSKSSISFKLRL